MYLFSNTAYGGITMTNHSDLSPEMQERYGVTPTRSKAHYLWIGLAGIIVATVAFTVYRSINPQVAGELTSFTVVSDHQIDMQWRVVRPAQQQTFCVVRAQDRNRFDVGYATVAIPAGDKTTRATYSLATSSRAVLAQVLGCSSSPTMHVPPANFPPGVKIPVQPSPGVAPTP
jgi:hypothetical protein